MKNSLSEQTSQPPLCVVTPYQPSLSETFIRVHLERLPVPTVMIHGWPPMIEDHAALSIPRRLTYKLLNAIPGSPVPNATTAGYLSAFRRIYPAAVLAEYGTTGALVTDACRRLGLPLIVHFHGYDASRHDVLRAHEQAYKTMFEHACAIICVSKAMHQRLISLGATPQKLHYNPYGVDCESFAHAIPSSSEPVFLAVGRFVEKKAPVLTIESFAETHRVFPEARLRMIGDGPLLDLARQTARDLQLSQAIEFLGPQPPEVVQREMRSARCFVQHSIEAPDGDSEGTPVGILEAMASGLPVVSTRHAGIPDVVIEDVTGFLVDEKDVTGMSKHMSRFILEPELAGRMGSVAREHILENFSQEKSLGNLWTIIQNCIQTFGINSALL